MEEGKGERGKGETKGGKGGRAEEKERRKMGEEADLMKTARTRLGSCITCWAFIHRWQLVLEVSRSFAQP